jgi:hypothetical protein
LIAGWMEPVWTVKHAKSFFGEVSASHTSVPCSPFLKAHQYAATAFTKRLADSLLGVDPIEKTSVDLRKHVFLAQCFPP